MSVHDGFQRFLLALVFIIIREMPPDPFPSLKTFLRVIMGWVPVAHACNSSYSGSRDQEDLQHEQIVCEALS
jgi:hypothetical protein